MSLKVNQYKPFTHLFIYLLTNILTINYITNYYINVHACRRCHSGFHGVRCNEKLPAFEMLSPSASGNLPIR